MTLHTDGQGEEQFCNHTGDDCTLHRLADLQSPAPDPGEDERVAYLDGWRDGNDDRLRQVTAERDELQRRVDGAVAYLDRQHPDADRLVGVGITDLRAILGGEAGGQAEAAYFQEREDAEMAEHRAQLDWEAGRQEGAFEGPESHAEPPMGPAARERVQKDAAAE